jgi:hypothetical protein
VATFAQAGASPQKHVELAHRQIEAAYDDCVNLDSLLVHEIEQARRFP